MYIVPLQSAMDNWDENPADPIVLKKITSKSKWEGEDEEDDVKDSWDQDPEEEKSDEETKPSPPPPPSTKKNLKKIGEKYEEKERKKLQELEKQVKQLTPEEQLAEKVRQQKLQEESDRILAKEIFGSTTGLDSKEDFDKLKTDFLNVISDSSKNSNYTNFAEQIIQGLCVHLSSVDLKKISTMVSNLHIEKSKLEKGDKKKNKGKGKAKLKMEGDNDFSEYSTFNEDFDDFI